MCQREKGTGIQCRTSRVSEIWVRMFSKLRRPQGVQPAGACRRLIMLHAPDHGFVAAPKIFWVCRMIFQTSSEPVQNQFTTSSEPVQTSSQPVQNQFRTRSQAVQNHFRTRSNQFSVHISMLSPRVGINLYAPTENGSQPGRV